MTIREYILQKLTAFGLTDAHLLDMSIQNGIDLDTEYSYSVSAQVGVALVDIVCEMLLAPKQTSINENGFSQTWDFDNLGKYYIWLCRKYGVPMDDNVSDILGVSTIKDKTDIW